MVTCLSFSNHAFSKPANLTTCVTSSSSTLRDTSTWWYASKSYNEGNLTALPSLTFWGTVVLYIDSTLPTNVVNRADSTRASGSPGLIWTRKVWSLWPWERGYTEWRCRYVDRHGDLIITRDLSRGLYVHVVAHPTITLSLKSVGSSRTYFRNTGRNTDFTRQVPLTVVSWTASRQACIVATPSVVLQFLFSCCHLDTCLLEGPQSALR